MKNIPIGEVLLQYGYITKEQIDQALIIRRNIRASGWAPF